MSRDMKSKITLAIIIIAIACVLSLIVTKAALNYVDTKTGNDVAMMQMQNVEGATEAYEAYRSIRNDINTWVPIVIGGIAIIAIGLIFIPGDKSDDDDNSECDV